MDSSTIYHTATESNKNQILSEGLQSTAFSQTLLSDTQIKESDGWYYYPTETSLSKLDYANALILTVLEEKRPKTYPKHHECQFFFPTLDLVGELNRPVVLEIQTESIADYPVYQADFKTAERLFFDTLRDFEIGDEVKKTTLQSLSKKYWNSATQLSSVNTADKTAELLIPIDTINPKYIDLYE